MSKDEVTLETLADLLESILDAVCEIREGQDALRELTFASMHEVHKGLPDEPCETCGAPAGVPCFKKEP